MDTTDQPIVFDNEAGPLIPGNPSVAPLASTTEAPLTPEEEQAILDEFNGYPRRHFDAWVAESLPNCDAYTRSHLYEAYMQGRIDEIRHLKNRSITR